MPNLLDATEDELENIQLEDADYAEALGRLIERARTDFWTYLLLFNPPGNSSFTWSKVHEYLVGLVQKVMDGEAKSRQAVSLSPQHGKSQILSREAVSWIMGRFPGKHVAITGYSADLVTDFSKWSRDRVQTPLYQKIFPSSTIVEGDNIQDTWRMTNGSSMRARSTGSKLTGRRVDVLVVDDPHPGRKEAESATQREDTVDWYYADCYTRLSPEAVVFLIGTRFHPQDLIGELTNEDKVADLRASGFEKEIFEVTNFTAICDDPENDPLGREEGEALFPEVRNISFLLSIKHNIPNYEWESQYMGRPKTGASDQADTKKLIHITLKDVPTHLERARAWDFALTEKQRSDFTAGLLGCYDPVEDKLYLIDGFRNKKTWVKNRKHVLERTEQDRQDYGCRRIGIEGVAGFGAVHQDLQDALLGEVRVELRFSPRGSKLQRAQPWLLKIEAGRVYIVDGAWTKDFITELGAFPDGNHDDYIDAGSILWEMFTGRNRNGVPQKQGRVINRPSVTVRPSSLNRPSSASVAVAA